MSWWKKSKYNQRQDWWQDEEDYYRKKNGEGVGYRKVDDEYDDYGGYYGGYGGGYYGSYGYQKPLDMSISLETRAKQLIQGITGKRVKVISAKGWGLKDEFFFYRASDLTNATDDEILGRIIHVIAQEKYAVKRKLLSTAAPYQELHDALEENRADYQIQVRYPGSRYYSRNLWERVKYMDNPVPVLEALKEKEQTLEEWVKAQHNRDLSSFDQDEQLRLTEHYESVQLQKPPSENPAWEFNFNIKAALNDETDFDFTKEETLENFRKAEPFIRQYFEMTAEDELRAAFNEIKKYYPKPNAKQRQQMQQQANGGTEGGNLSEQAMQDAIDQAKKQAARDVENQSAKDAAQHFFGKQGSLDVADHEVQKALNEYNAEKAKQLPVINTLHAFIRSILKDNDAVRYSRPYKKGKIDMRRLYKYVAQDNMRIFKRRIMPTDKRYVMTIMIDMSGSMQGSNANNAFRGALILAEVFEMLKLPYEIIGFEGRPYIFKSFGRPLQRAIMPSLKKASGGTNDALALELVKKHIATEVGINDKQPKGVFVITDGMSGAASELKELVDEMENTRNTKVYGIGIGGVSEQDLQKVYNNYFVVSDVNQLPRELTNLMRSQFRRG